MGTLLQAGGCGENHKASITSYDFLAYESELVEIGKAIRDALTRCDPLINDEWLKPWDQMDEYDRDLFVTVAEKTLGQKAHVAEAYRILGESLQSHGMSEIQRHSQTGGSVRQ